MSLLSASDPPSLTRINWTIGRKVLFVCDHASCLAPEKLGTLGLERHEIEQHIGWDIGASAVTASLAALLNAPAILAGYSRLVIDLNRYPHEPSSIVENASGTSIPGNFNLSQAARDARRIELFEPYHTTIDDWLVRSFNQNVVPALVSIHSFVPVMSGVSRPWHIGVLWDHDGRIPVQLMRVLSKEKHIVVGDNEPYSGREPAGYYTVRHHAVRRGLPHIVIELRQDLISTAEGIEEWANRLAVALNHILANEETFEPLQDGVIPSIPLPSQQGLAL